MTQPIKPVTRFQEYLSSEIKDFIRRTIKADLPVKNNTILTIDLFFAGLLSDPGCLGFRVLNSHYTSYTIANMFTKLMLSLGAKMDKETNFITPRHEGEQPKIDFEKLPLTEEFRVLMNYANQERSEEHDKFICTDHVLLAFLNNEKEFSTPLIDIFKEENLNYDTLKKLSRKWHETTADIIGAVDTAPEDVSDINGVTIVGPIGEDGVWQDGNFIFRLPQDQSIGTSFLPLIHQGSKSQPKKDKDDINYCINLTKLAKKNSLDPVIGREDDIRRIFKVLLRRQKGNVLVVGESGVGKTCLIDGLAIEMSKGNLPEKLSDYSIYKLNTLEISAGTQFRGMFEGRMAELTKTLRKRGDVILFIDNIESVIGDGNRNAECDFVTPLKEILSDKSIKVIATITPGGLRNIERTGLLSRMQKLTIEKPNIETCIEILSGLKGVYEKHHNVIYDKEAIKACVTLSDRYISEKVLPTSAIDILDEAGANTNLKKSASSNKIELEINELKKQRDDAYVKDDIDTVDRLTKVIKDKWYENINEEENNKPVITADDIYAAVSDYTKIPIQKLNLSEKNAVAEIDKVLKSVIVGQDEAIERVSRAIKRSKVGLYPKNRPIFTALCVGNTGCGKTLMAKTLAKEIFGDEKNLIRLDMSEYQDKTSVNKLIGASAGYVGYNEGGLLTEAVKNKKHAVVLFDEIEKAEPSIFNVLLQILDEGFLTDNTGYKVDFKNTIVIMTSNVGAKKAAANKGIGFSVDDSANRKDIIEKEIKKTFNPEFINRLDEITYFNDLTNENLKEIIKLELKKVAARVENIGNYLTWDDSVIDFILELAIKEKEYGARPILRIIQKNIEDKITDHLLTTDDTNITFNFSMKDGELCF